MSTTTQAPPCPTGARRSLITEQGAQAGAHLSAERFDRAEKPERILRKSSRQQSYQGDTFPAKRENAEDSTARRPFVSLSAQADLLATRETPAPSTDQALADSRARFGPRSAPLFYTALQDLPGRLVWEAQPGAEAYRVVVGIPESESEIRPLLAATTGTRSLPLSGLSLEPGTVYAWRVEPVAFEAPMAQKASSEQEATDEPRWAGQGFWQQEGRFWLLEPGLAARWEHGSQLVAPMADPDFRVLGLALLMAEVGLYHEALLHIKNSPMAQAREARLTLAHTAQALIYKQMAQRMEAERGAQAGQGTLPANFYAWVAAREQHHRQKVAARLGQEQTPGSAPGSVARGLTRQTFPEPTRRAA